MIPYSGQIASKKAIYLQRLSRALGVYTNKFALTSVLSHVETAGGQLESLSTLAAGSPLKIL